MTQVDIVVPIYNSLDHVRECILSLLKHRREDDRIILVNDGSHGFVEAELDQLVAEKKDVILHHKPTNQGYLQAINTGLSFTTAPIVILLNSDTIIFADFFERVTNIFNTHSDVGIVNPVSVWANWTRIPFPDGQSIFSLDSLVKEKFTDEIVDIHNASGFCFAIRKELLDQFNGLDMAFDPGYWEETDLCMKTLEAQSRVVCAKGIFVYHHGWASFGESERNENMKKNELIFRNKWGDKYKKLETWYKFNNPLATQINELKKLDINQSNVVINNQTSQSISVLYVVKGIKHYGGVISIIQVVNRLIMSGINANIAVYGEVDLKVFRYGAGYVRPLRFKDESDLLANCPQVDILVATHWSTTYPVIKLATAGKCKSTAYFVQDFEPDFYEADTEEYNLALMSYHLIPNRICKTPWLKKKLDRFPGQTQVIPLGLNLDIFANYGYEKLPQLVSMARPSSRYRNWQMTRRVFEIIQSKRPDIRCAVYGFGYSQQDLLPGIYDYGTLSDAKEVATMLNQSSVLLDCSTYQGFGRPGLEAMACGTNAVLTKNGGITSYAKHLHNCLLVDPFDIVGIVESIIRIFDDQELANKLRKNGQLTASHYSQRIEGESTVKFLKSVLHEENKSLNEVISFASLIA